MNRRLQFGIDLLWMIPFMPVLYIQGKNLRSNFPDLPEPQDVKGEYAHPLTNEEPIKMLIIGESTMAGVGARTHKQAFAGSMAKELGQQLQRNVHWKVHAQSGITMKRLANELVPTIQQKEADLIVVGMGANDAFHLNPPARWRKNVETLVRQIRKQFPESIICFCSMPPIKDFTAFNSIMKLVVGRWSKALGEEVRNYAATAENLYFDDRPIHLDHWITHLPKGGKIEDLFSDGIHPSEKAYQIWGQEMAHFTANLMKSN